MSGVADEAKRLKRMTQVIGVSTGLHNMQLILPCAKQKENTVEQNSETQKSHILK